MGAPAEILEEIFTVIEGGQQVGTSAEIIQFPTDNGSGTVSLVQKTLKGTNGTGVNYWVAAVANGASAISAGALYIGCTFPEFIALAVPCLGIAIGTIWYNMDPEFWNGVAEKLVDAGYTLNGKVISYMNTEGNLTFPKGAVEILSDALIDAGVFELGESVLPEEQQSELFHPDNYSEVHVQAGIEGLSRFVTSNAYGQYEMWISFSNLVSNRTVKTGMLIAGTSSTGYGTAPMAFSKAPFSVDWSMVTYPAGGSAGGTLSGQEITRNGQTYYVATPHGMWSMEGEIAMDSSAVSATWNTEENVWDIAYIDDHGDVQGGEKEDTLQKGATYPKKNVPWGDLFPDWIPWEFPLIQIGSETYQLPAGLPTKHFRIVPVEEPYQKEAQDPDPATETDPDDALERVTNPENDPRTKPRPGVDTGTDPDTGAEDEENLDKEPPVDQPDPVPPDPDPIPTPIIPVPLPPASVHSNKMFTVYSPNSSQLDALGGYLWDDNLIETLKRIWQNPLDGIIGLSQVYCTPTTGGSHNIILGYLDSGVSAPVVSDQFAHIDCGTVTIPEINQNATDYNPYTSMQIYLPFIGITEVDVNEFMSGSISIKYHIDVYTGTCLAEVKMIRTRDVPNGGIVYTFSGNCSQQLPLTSGDQKGLLSALIGAAGIGIGIASGGAVITATAASAASAAKAGARLAGAAANNIAGEVGRDVTREMVHVSHSGNLSANAGIMGQKKPYVIISRKRPYNANNYNKLYGFPSNKTVFLSNYSGYVKIKACRLRSKATEAEKAEIIALCAEGIIM